MKVVQYRSYGDASRLEVAERPRPRPRGRHLIVRVAYSSVNPIDWKLRDGMARFLLPLRMPVIPGFDIAGEVVEVGSRVRSFSPGDWVFARLNSISGGAAAEYASVSEKAAALIPAELSVKDAAAIPLAGLTALQALTCHPALREGKAEGRRVLIIGASGGVGTFAVQIAKAYGAHVTGVCSGSNAGLVRRLGADEVIDYEKTSDFQHGDRYDLIVDLIVKAPPKVHSRYLARDGVYVATIPSPRLLTKMFFGPIYSTQRARFITVKSSGSGLAKLGALATEGRLEVVVDSVYPLAELGAAHERSETGHAVGKILVEVCPQCLPR